MTPPHDLDIDVAARRDHARYDVLRAVVQREFCAIHQVSARREQDLVAGKPEHV